MTDEFIAELIQLCRKHRAVLFPRTDGKRLILAVEIPGREYPTVTRWLDFTRIDGTEAKPFRD